ncbi:485_t:CDS:2, partial [Rhizophagus irregularis]
FKIPSSTQILFTIHLAMPRNKQYIGSTTMNLIGSKYDNRNNSDHLTPVSFVKHFREALELQRTSHETSTKAVRIFFPFWHSNVRFRVIPLHSNSKSLTIDAK